MVHHYQLTRLTILQWPPIKKKAMEAHPSFAAFLGSAPKATSTPKATPKKRKSGTPDAEESIKETTEVTPDEDGGSPKKKKAPAKGRGRPKKTRTEEAKVEPEKAKAEPEDDNSADGGDGPSKYILNQKVIGWLTDTDIE
jgi:hypothetical protein